MKNSTSEQCPHCDPLPGNPAHTIERWESRILWFLRPLELTAIAPQLFHRIERGIITGLLASLRRLRLLREDRPQRETITNRTWVVIEEAWRRGHQVRQIFIHKLPTRFFRYTFPQGQSFIFDILPHLDVRNYPGRDLDDKEILRQILRAIDAPVPEGGTAVSSRRLYHLAQTIGFPLVVKPRRGSLSKHTFTNITSVTQLQEAIEHVRRLGPEVLIEQFIPGDVHRVTVVANNVIATVRRLPPNVTGNGIHTIRELISIKNNDPRRGPIHDLRSTLHHLPSSSHVEATLAEKNLTMESILDTGDRCVLHTKMMLAAGADIEDCTDDMHSETRKMIERVAQTCAVDVMGFDIVCPDITVSYHAQPFAIIEANIAPFIDMHHAPSVGSPRNVAGAIIDMLERKYC